MAIVNHEGDGVGTAKQAAAHEIHRLIRDNEFMDHYIAANELTDKQKAEYVKHYNAYFERINKILNIKEAK